MTKETKVIEMENENVNAEVQQDTVEIVEKKKLDRKTIGKIVGGVAAGAAVAFGIVKIVAGMSKKGSDYGDDCTAADADFEPSSDYATEE